MLRSWWGNCACWLLLSIFAVYRYRDFTTDPDRFELTQFKTFVDR
jgi:hypothetical protein